MSIVFACMVPHPPVLLPEIGGGREKEISATAEAYEEAVKRIAAFEPETVIITTPHSTIYSDYFHISPGNTADGSLSEFGAGQVQFHETYDTEFVRELIMNTGIEDFMAGTLGARDKALDHGTMVPLYYLRKYYKDYKLVRIGLSGLPLADHYRLGQYIQETAALLKRKTVFMASGDLSHRLKADGPYGFAEDGPKYDKQIMDVMGTGNFLQLFDFSGSLCEKAAECGHRSFTIMAGALDKKKITAERLSYEGTFGVGYGICTFSIDGEDDSRNFRDQYESEKQKHLQEKKAEEDRFVSLARRSLETYVKEGRVIPVPKDLPSQLTEGQAGAFVSIHKDGQLRGCIGTISPVRSCLAEEIIENAVSAAVKDPRFHPVTEGELRSLEYSVDVLGPMEQITSEKELDVKRYGVVVSEGVRRGLLLPDLDGVDTVTQQIDIAKQKAGIEKEEQVTLQRFEVIRHK